MNEVAIQVIHTVAPQLQLNQPRQMGHPFARVLIALNESASVVWRAAQKPLPHLWPHLKGGGTNAGPQPRIKGGGEVLANGRLRGTVQPGSKGLECLGNDATLTD
jgi:hypothetical protein